MHLARIRRKITILPPFTRTGVRMTTSLVSMRRGRRVKPGHPANAVSAQIVQNVLNAPSVMDVVVRRVAVSAMSVADHPVAPARTSLCVKTTPR